MSVVSKKTVGTVKTFWDEISPASQAEKPWLNYFYSDKFLTFSYKDLLAQANCTAAFLMQQGVRKGDCVLIISGPSPFYFVTDLALQFLGAVNISIPEGTDSLRIGEIIRENKVKFTFVEDPEVFLGLGQLTSYKEHLSSVVLCSEEVDDMDPEKLITFESLINRGKSAWREDAAGLQNSKESVVDSDVYALLFDGDDTKYALSPLSFGEFISKVRAAADRADKEQFQAIATCVPAHRLIFRTQGLFPSMLRRTPVYMMPLDVMNPGVMNSFNPSALVLGEEYMRDFYEFIPQRFMGQNSSAHRTLNSAATVYKKWDAANLESKKPPVTVRLRYKWLQKTLFRYINKQLGGKLSMIITDSYPIEAKISDFFRHLGFEIDQVKG